MGPFCRGLLHTSMAPARRSTKWVAPVLAASGAIALGVALWRWTSQKDRPDTSARSKRKGAVCTETHSQ